MNDKRLQAKALQLEVVASEVISVSRVCAEYCYKHEHVCFVSTPEQAVPIILAPSTQSPS